MKSIHLITLSLVLVFLSGCHHEQTASLAPEPAPAPSESEGANDEGRADNGFICSYFCERKIQELCQDDIADRQANGENLEESIFDTASCQLYCEADWDETTFACVSDADECAQFSSQDPYCIDDAAETETVEQKMPKGCFKACENYTLCTGYGDDVTPQDLDDAFATCMEVCPTWDKKAQDCIASTPISRPADCAAQTACILPDVRQMMEGR